MSKKIAQLTNVIHHLHTKTEDHEMDLQEMAAAYESEIESMLKDAATRINSFKNQLEAARDDSRFQQAVQKVKAEHDKMRQVIRGAANLIFILSSNDAKTVIPLRFYVAGFSGRADGVQTEDV